MHIPWGTWLRTLGDLLRRKRWKGKERGSKKPNPRQEWSPWTHDHKASFLPLRYNLENSCYHNNLLDYSWEKNQSEFTKVMESLSNWSLDMDEKINIIFLLLLWSKPNLLSVFKSGENYNETKGNFFSGWLWGLFIDIGGDVDDDESIGTKCDNRS